MWRTNPIVKNMYGSQFTNVMFIIITHTTPRVDDILKTLNPYSFPGNIFAINAPIFVFKNVYVHPHKNDTKKHKLYDFW